MRQALPLTMIVSLELVRAVAKHATQGSRPLRAFGACTFPWVTGSVCQWASNVSEVSKAGKCQ